MDGTASSPPGQTELVSWRRTAARYLIPSLIATPDVYFRDRAIVSFTSKVQLSSAVRLGRGTVVKRYSIVQTSGGGVTFGKTCAIGAFWRR